jgi:SAM-dependent methyltransferase
VSLLGAMLRDPRVSKVGRAAVDWMDLEGSSVVESLRRVAPRAHGRLLDVGCGDKPYEHIFLPFVDSYLGIEHEATYAITDAGARGHKADLLYDGMRLPFEDRSFDTVLSIQVLEHTPRPGELLCEMARVLRDDGVLVVSVPFSFRLHEEPHDYFRFTPHVMRELGRSAGLEMEEIVPRGSLWSVVGHKLNSYLGLQVAQMGGLAQIMGKLPHEQTASSRGREWTLPVIAPAMMGLALWARIFDRLLPDPTEMLGMTIIAKRSAVLGAASPCGATHQR